MQRLYIKKTKNMKKINLLLIALLLVATVSAQNRKAEKKLVGTWTLVEIELENADELAQTILDLQVGILEQQIIQLEDILKGIEDETEKETYIAQLEELITMNEEFTLESVKEEFTKELDNLKETYILVFNKDKSSKSLLDNKEGTWKLNKKATELTITEGESDIVFSITELTKNKLDMVFEEEQGEMKVIMNMVFTKNKK